MICFKLIKDVLDEIYVGLPAKSRDDQIRDKLRELEKEYRKLLVGVKVDYSNPATRFAYVFKYVTSHANMVFQVIEFNKQLGKCFDEQRLTLTCIGGGPGSDLLGVLKYLDEYNKAPQIMCYLLDRERLWNETWGDVGSKVGTEFMLSTNVMPFDILDKKSWEPFVKYLNADIFTLIYFISEIYKKRAEAEPFFDHLFTKAKKNSYMLFIDNGAYSFYEWFDGLVTKHHYNIVESAQGKIRMPQKEQAADLGEYFDKFGSPKITANIAYRIIQKP